MEELRDLWHGRLPLPVAFWRYAVAYGLALNVIFTGAAWLLLALDYPFALFLLMHFLPAPYFVAAAAGVWRSADRFRGSSSISQAAKVGVLAWSVFLLVAPV